MSPLWAGNTWASVPAKSQMDLTASSLQRSRAAPDEVLQASLSLWSDTLSESGVMAVSWKATRMPALQRSVTAAAERRRALEAAAMVDGSPPPSVRTARPLLGGAVLVASSDLDVAGLATTAGLAILQAGCALVDTPAITALRQAGAQLLGTTSQGPLGMGTTAPGVKNVSEMVYERKGVGWRLVSHGAT